jgi:hypothetical protein
MRTLSNAARSAPSYRRQMISIACRWVTLKGSGTSQTETDGATLTPTEAPERVRLLLSCGF